MLPRLPIYLFSADLRDDIERERDETLVDGAGFPSVLKSARQQLIANTAALLTALGS